MRFLFIRLFSETFRLTFSILGYSLSCYNPTYIFTAPKFLQFMFPSKQPTKETAEPKAMPIGYWSRSKISHEGDRRLETTTLTSSGFFYRMLIWNKARTIYISNNWMYTTNHKRIAVNYFWFVIFAGIVGMVLATIIRLEMAYPGVGILAGDSLQYLSIVTAHAVIMVFFMIMPLMFGAFGNFLLPTQLGVHDVAFPRLNSAAFWFLPAGLIMLCQLVCLDRRYQRMNCFNIREVQSLLKNRFFADLLNVNDHHDLLSTTAIGIRYKTNDLNVINPNMLLAFHHGLIMVPKGREQSYFKAPSAQIGSYSRFTINSYFHKHITFMDYYLTPLMSYPLFGDVLTSIVNGYISLINLTNYPFTSRYFNNCEVSVGVFSYAIPNTIFLSNTIVEAFELSGPFDARTSQLGKSWTNIPHVPVSIHKPSLDHILLDWYPQIKTFETLLPSWEDSINTILGLPEFVRTTIVELMESVDHFIIMLAPFLVNFLYKLTKDIRNSYPMRFGAFVKDSAELTISAMLFPMEDEGIDDEDHFDELEIVTESLGLFDFFLYNSFIARRYESYFRRLPLHVYDTESHSSASKLWSSLNLNDKASASGEEISSNFRRQRFGSPVFIYEYKTGNYFPQSQVKVWPHLYTSICELTRGLRKPAWFFSDTFKETFDLVFQNYSSLYVDIIDSEMFHSRSTSAPTNGFLNFFYTLSDSTNFMNQRWLSVSSLDQKFYRMYSASSLQQRIYGNWRQLKFTREAWRCRLLSARHQKTLYRRYVIEDDLFWAVERNAKDVLPGWAMITPFSARTRFTAIGKVDIGLMGVFLVLNSSIVSSANFLVTYRYLSTLNNRKMRDARSFFTEGVMVASWMMIAANPMLAIGILMLLSDRHWQTSFFDYSGGGDTVLFQHMFWFFGHPEVYVIMIPAFGFNNTILSFYLRKRVSARASLMYSMYTIAFLGFFVWGHHMYMVGLAHTTRMLFSTLTVMISVPAATKLMHWCVTLVNSSFWVELPFLFSLLFIFFFVSGGISGMAVAHTGMDILFHDSFYVIGHFHVMFAGAAMFASFGAFYFYFPSIFGVKFSRIWGYLHITYFLLGQLMTVIPMFWLGYSGMPRRILDYPAALGGWHAIVSAGHLLSVAGLMAFFIMIFDSLRQGRAATRNSFGISRFNTRFNFYLYEIARTRHVQRRGWYISRYSRPNALSLNKLNYNNNELLETTLYSYVLVKS